MLAYISAFCEAGSIEHSLTESSFDLSLGNVENKDGGNAGEWQCWRNEATERKQSEASGIDRIASNAFSFRCRRRGLFLIDLHLIRAFWTTFRQWKPESMPSSRRDDDHSPQDIPSRIICGGIVRDRSHPVEQVGHLCRAERRGSQVSAADTRFARVRLPTPSFSRVPTLAGGIGEEISGNWAALLPKRKNISLSSGVPYLGRLFIGNSAR